MQAKQWLAVYSRYVDNENRGERGIVTLWDVVTRDRGFSDGASVRERQRERTERGAERATSASFSSTYMCPSTSTP